MSDRARASRSSAGSSPADRARERLDEVGWGVFLIMTGALWLTPSVPNGTWLTGVGVLLLGLNAVRYQRFGEWSAPLTVLGALALLAGSGELLGVDLPLFALSAIVLGAVFVLRPYLKSARPRRGDTAPPSDHDVAAPHG